MLVLRIKLLIGWLMTIGKDHDAAVLLWRDLLVQELKMETCEVCH